jgi:sec-independent protein translocase protein TatA
MESIMGSFSIWHWLVVGIIILLLFGKGRFSDMMGDVAKGLKSFKKGLAEDENAAPEAPAQRIEGRPAAPPVTPEETVARDRQA